MTTNQAMLSRPSRPSACRQRHNAERRHVHPRQWHRHLLRRGGPGRSRCCCSMAVLMSTSPVWDGFPGAWVSHMATFAQHFRVIAPDIRGYGRTINAGGGSICCSTFADDIVALIDALGLEQPMLCGFSDGGMTATIVGMQHPGLVRAIVNDAGYDVFNPQRAIVSHGAPDPGRQSGCDAGRPCRGRTVAHLL